MIKPKIKYSVPDANEQTQSTSSLSNYNVKNLGKPSKKTPKFGTLSESGRGGSEKSQTFFFKI